MNFENVQLKAKTAGYTVGAVTCGASAKGCHVSASGLRKVADLADSLGLYFDAKAAEYKAAKERIKRIEAQIRAEDEAAAAAEAEMAEAEPTEDKPKAGFKNISEAFAGEAI